MKLKTKNIYIYYDFPIVFSASDEEGKVFICLFTEEINFNLRYLCVEISKSNLIGLENNQVDVRSIFKESKKFFIININSQSEEPVDAIETSEDIAAFLPDEGLFIGNEENKTLQTIPFQSIVIEANSIFNNSSLSYYTESLITQFDFDYSYDTDFSGDYQCLMEAA